MPQSRTINLRPKAVTDLEDIFDYSVPKFGIARAEQYILELNEAFTNLAEEPYIGKDYAHVKSELMGIPVVSHIVFYKYTSTQLIIIRVLHKSMDYIRHL
jgi:toxin ParE1/3/4